MSVLPFWHCFVAFRINWQEDENQYTYTQTDRWCNPLIPDAKNTTVTDE